MGKTIYHQNRPVVEVPILHFLVAFKKETTNQQVFSVNL